MDQVTAEEQLAVREELRWRRGLVLLLAVGGIMVVCVGAVVALNWARLVSLLGEGRATLAQLSNVQAAVRREFGAANVTVRSMHRTGVDGPILSVHLLNPKISQRTERRLLEVKAREVALVARRALREPREYPNIEVVLSWQVGFGVRVARNQRFLYDDGDFRDTGGSDAQPVATSVAPTERPLN